MPRIFCCYVLSLGYPICRVVASFALVVCTVDVEVAVFDVLVVDLPTLPTVEVLFCE